MFAWNFDRPTLLDVLPRAPRLRWIQSISAGVEDFVSPALAAHGVVLTSAAGVYDAGPRRVRARVPARVLVAPPRGRPPRAGRVAGRRDPPAPGNDGPGGRGGLDRHRGGPSAASGRAPRSRRRTHAAPTRRDLRRDRGFRGAACRARPRRPRRERPSHHRCDPRGVRCGCLRGDATPRRLREHRAGRDGRRACADRGPRARPDRRRGAGRLRGGAAAGREPALADAERVGVAAPRRRSRAVARRTSSRSSSTTSTRFVAGEPLRNVVDVELGYAPGGRS